MGRNKRQFTDYVTILFTAKWNHEINTRISPLKLWFFFGGFGAVVDVGTLKFLSFAFKCAISICFLFWSIYLDLIIMVELGTPTKWNLIMFTNELFLFFVVVVDLNGMPLLHDLNLNCDKTTICEYLISMNTWDEGKKLIVCNYGGGVVKSTQFAVDPAHPFVILRAS